jgi:hypothetical protein
MRYALFVLRRYSNKTLIESPIAIRVIAFANIGAMEMVRMNEDALTASVAPIVSVIIKEDRSDALSLSTALPDKTRRKLHSANGTFTSATIALASGRLLFPQIYFICRATLRWVL